MRAIELYAESVAREILLIILPAYPPHPPFESVRCTRLAEFNFFIDKIKIGKLQCTKNNDMTVELGYLASAAIPEGNYYLATNAEVIFSFGGEGVVPYLKENAISEGNRFQ